MPKCKCFCVSLATFSKYLFNRKETCQGRFMAINPTSNGTQSECEMSCKRKPRCNFFFYTKECGGSDTCAVGKGCCALFSSCEGEGRLSKIDLSGDTWQKVLAKKQK